MILSCIAAMSENGIIGRDNRIPWRLPSDLAHFKRTTMGHTIVMGRKTWESIGRKPLPGRRHIVISAQDPYPVPPEVVVVGSWEEAMDRASDEDEVFIVGGASLYEPAVAVAERIYLTVVHAEVEGDVHFPVIELSRFRLVSEDRHEPDDKNEFAHTFRLYERI
jgi:dihydrofolate reductase